MEIINELGVVIKAALPMGAAELVIVGAAVTAGFWFILRSVIKPIFSKMYNMAYYTLNLTQSDNLLNNFNNWLVPNMHRALFVRNFKPGMTTDGEEVMVPGEGSFLIKPAGLPFVLINRSIKNEDWRGPVEQTSIQLFTRDKRKVAKFYKMLDAESIPPNIVKHQSYSSWEDTGLRKDIHKMVSKASVRVRDDLARFLTEANREAYRSKGLAYRRGYLLSGAPGTGKSNLVAYLSKEFDIPVHVLGGDMNPRNVLSLLGTKFQRTSILLLEDADLSPLGNRRIQMERDKRKIKRGGKRKKYKNLNEAESREAELEEIESNDDSLKATMLQAFLNALDGIVEVDNFIFFCTTNRVDGLDPALLRPGRLDVHIEMMPLTSEEQMDYFNWFYSTKMAAPSGLADRTIANLVNVLSKHIDNPDAAMSELLEHDVVLYDAKEISNA